MSEKNEAAERLPNAAKHFVSGNDAAGRLTGYIWRDVKNPERAQKLLDEALAAERRATVERVMDTLENAVAKPGAFPKGELMSLFARVRDEEAAR